MRAFARLLDRLFFTYGNLAKAKLLLDYLSETPDPDRGYAVAIIAGALDLPGFKRGMIRDLIAARVDPVLVDLSYDYVGELSETVAHLWPVNQPAANLPSLAEIVTALKTLPKASLAQYAAARLDEMNSAERWAFLKLGSRGGLRIGVSARFLKQVLAQLGGRDVEEIERA
jgi:DNA ligase-1